MSRSGPSIRAWLTALGSDLTSSSSMDGSLATSNGSSPAWLHEQPLAGEDSALETPSSELQHETAEECLPLLLRSGSLVEVDETGLPKLDRRRHARFLQQFLGGLPAPFMMADASRPWFFYWCTMALHLLGDDASAFKER